MWQLYKDMHRIQFMNTKCPFFNQVLNAMVVRKWAVLTRRSKIRISI